MSKSIFDLLGYGPENGTTLKTLTRITQLDGRSVRRLIQGERLQGRLIISDCSHGYFKPGDAGEARRYIRSMNHRAREIARVAQAAEAALAEAEGQTRIGGM